MKTFLTIHIWHDTFPRLLRVEDLLAAVNPEINAI